ncbi:hypothetical protein BVC93_24385 [Mycobacterium sp. MS1601]|uniref:HEPN domain-containing protein n=1 Tax=Mycobacterium sp. MS1601 TaxID=1936029 RepID=UPI0009793298|nr:HEPN domain-containing protein [Mycobacterium sp. MS1601]AQA05021.1 hypothetical protein BVC93_24385 [Mycobacterium sp. MS1601]
MAARLKEIEEIILYADAEEDLIVKDYLHTLAVIRLSGFIEKSVEHMVNGFLEEHSSHRVLRYGQRQAARINNLNPAKLEQLVGSFDQGWEVELREFLAEDENRQSLGNLIGARHTLAHGGSTSVSSALLRGYQKIAEEVIYFLLDRFLPLPGPRQ